MLVKTVTKTSDYVSTYPRIKMVECRNCGCTFTPSDEWNTCLECMHCHCDCGLCWDAAESDTCPACYSKHEEPDNYQYKLYTLPGSSLTYWA
jgi:hypothetical protein